MTLLVLFLVVPIVELAILFQLAERFSWGSTILLVLLTGTVGAILARREGVKALRRMQEELSAGRTPSGAILDAVMIFCAGVLLVTPGVLTDALGLAMLLAPFRRWIGGKILESARKRMVVVHLSRRADFVDVDARTNRTGCGDSDGAEADQPRPVIVEEIRVIDAHPRTRPDHRSAG